MILLTTTIDTYYYVKVVVEYILIYLLCFGGLFTKDLLYSKKANVKVDIKSTMLYSIPSTIIMAAVYSLLTSKHFDITVWAFICYIDGLWSREILCILTNTKFAYGILKYVSSKVLPDASDDVKDDISNAISSVVDEESSIEGNDNPPGEFDYDSIIDIYK